MNKILPLELPMIQTYQSSSFVLGIVMANEKIRNCYYNGYVNLCCKNVKSLDSIDLRFVGDLWEDYRLAGVAEMNMYYLKNIDKNNFLGFIKERIDQDNYILLYEIDDYYLSYSDSYLSKHFIHDTYLYGYSKNEFWVMAYKDKKLQKIMISNEEIIEGLYAALKLNPDLHFCSFRPALNVSIVFDKQLFLNQMIDYFNATSNSKDGLIYGMHIYNVLIDCIECIIDKYGIEKKELDLRPFRIIWEHKKSLIEHMKKCCEYIEVDEKYFMLLFEIEKNANNIFRLAIKYNVTFKKEYLCKLIDYIKENINMEHCFINALCIKEYL